MPVPDINPVAEGFATAGGLCFFAIAIIFGRMRAKANRHLPREHRISWFIAEAMWKTVVADYKRFYPRGWEYRALRMFQILWLTFFILSILALFLHSPV